jgi:hypothetical protein
MDLPIDSNELTPPTPTRKFFRKLRRIVMRLVSVAIIVFGTIYGVLGWMDYADTPRGGYAQTANPDGSVYGYFDSKTGHFTMGPPPSRIRDFFAPVKRWLGIGHDNVPDKGRSAEPAAISSNQGPEQVDGVPNDLLGHYHNDDYELIISHRVGTARDAANLSLRAHGTEVWTAAATMSGGYIQFYKDQTHDCPLIINRMTGRLGFSAGRGAKHCGDLSMTGVYYAN